MNVKDALRQRRRWVIPREGVESGVEKAGYLFTNARDPERGS